MSLSVTCHACGQEVVDSEKRRGFLINEKAKRGARLVELRELLARLPKSMINMRDRYIKDIAALEVQIAAFDAALEVAPTLAARPGEGDR